MLVVAALVVGGWWVWQKNRTKVTDAATDIGSSSSQNKPNNATSPELQNVVRIPELGVQIVVPDAIKDLVYEVSARKTPENKAVTVVSFSTESLVRADPKCGPDNSPMGSIARVDGRYPEAAEGDNSIAMEYGQLVKQFANFYISAWYPNGVCSTDPSFPSPPDGSWKSQLGGALSTVQELK